MVRVYRPCPICGDAVLVRQGDTGWLYRRRYYHVACLEGTDLHLELLRGRGRVIGPSVKKRRVKRRGKRRIGLLGY